eukprot:TRINITY_DN2560_c0_g1_i14.p1 TRINITY_DN2560_c0_g1~~TRINITY_DN2560_c0_g1_i14.p1  ORF type:complete len:744 (-),score=233.91 TRINITY_DN2560_c0_g1_i14:68-2299(-)
MDKSNTPFAALGAEAPRKVVMKGRPSFYVSLHQNILDDDDDNRNKTIAPAMKEPAKDSKNLYDSLLEGESLSFPFPAIKTWIWDSFKNPRWILDDFIAGSTVACVLIPNAMAESLIAGFSDDNIHYGLYSCMFPMMIYTFFGTSKLLAIGPMATACIILSEVFKQTKAYDAKSDEMKMMITQVFTMLVGIIVLILGFVKLSFLDSLLSRPAIEGFLSAVVINVITEQLIKVMQLKGIHVETIFEKFYEISKKIDQTNIASLLLFCGAFLMILALTMLKKKLNPKNPIVGIALQCTPIWVALTGAIVSTSLDLKHKYKVPHVKEIPAAFMPPQFPPIFDPNFPQLVAELLPNVMVICLIGYVESASISNKLSTQFGFRVDHNVELIAFGFSNFFGSFVRSFPIFGSLSRTPINLTCGGKTQLSTCFTAIFVLVAIIALSSAMAYIPMGCIISTIVFSLSKVIAVHEGVFLYKHHKFDFLQFAVAFLAVFIFGTDKGLYVCLGVSFLLVLKTTSTPSVIFQNLIKESSMFKDKNFQKLVGAAPVRGNQLQAINVEVNDRESKKKGYRKSVLERRTTALLTEKYMGKDLTYFDVCLCLDINCQKKAHILVVKLDKRLYYANCTSIKVFLEPVKLFMIERKKISRMIEQKSFDSKSFDNQLLDLKIQGPPIRGIIFDASKLIFIDYSSLKCIQELMDEFEAADVEIRLSHLKPEIVEALQAHGWDEDIVEQSRNCLLYTSPSPRDQA